MCVNETTPKSQKEVVAEKLGFCSMTMTSKQGAYNNSVRELELYKVTFRMKQVSRALYEICYIMKSFL